MKQPSVYPSSRNIQAIRQTSTDLTGTPTHTTDPRTKGLMANHQGKMKSNSRTLTTDPKAKSTRQSYRTHRHSPTPKPSKDQQPHIRASQGQQQHKTPIHSIITPAVKQDPHAPTCTWHRMHAAPHVKAETKKGAVVAYQGKMRSSSSTTTTPMATSTRRSYRTLTEPVKPGGGGAWYWHRMREYAVMSIRKTAYLNMVSANCAATKVKRQVKHRMA